MFDCERVASKKTVPDETPGPKSVVPLCLRFNDPRRDIGVYVRSSNAVSDKQVPLQRRPSGKVPYYLRVHD